MLHDRTFEIVESHSNGPSMPLKNQVPQFNNKTKVKGNILRATSKCTNTSFSFKHSTQSFRVLV